MGYQFQVRRDHSLTWASRNPILASGEPGYEVDTGRLKIGDGITRWVDLEGFATQSGEAGEVTDLPSHIDSATPHPVYDDGPSLSLLYENAKV